MTPLYTQEEFTRASGKTLLPIKCEYCSSKFYRCKTKIKYNVRVDPGAFRFCSVGCSNKHRRINFVERLCANCSKPILCSPGRQKDGPNGRSFCNHSCAAIYNNTHKTKGTRRSKLEIFLEKELSKLYPKLEIHFNKKDAINSELDIYIPSLGLAFELNGIFHYEPIFGIEKLNKIKNNDSRKFQACLEKGIELCIIDASSFTYFKEDIGLKYLKIVADIIESKLG